MTCEEGFSKNDYITLSNGQRMPLIGLGTSKGDRNKVKASVKVALDAGYRLIDTATWYANEAQIGEALQEAIEDEKLVREDVFIITKLPPPGMHPDRVERFLRSSLARLRLDYVDTYLLHMPFAVEYVNDDEMLPLDRDGRVRMDVTSDFIAVWKKMEEMVDLGLTKSIGVCNFNRKQIQRILDSCRLPPVCNQLEFHASNQRPLLTEFCNAKRIAVIAYAPLGSPAYGGFLENALGIKLTGLPKLLEDNELLRLSKKYNKTIPQILLHWIMRRGFVPIPKSQTPLRIRENIEILLEYNTFEVEVECHLAQIFDFYLLDEDVHTINGLEMGNKIFSLTYYKGFEEHPEFVAMMND